MQREQDGGMDGWRGGGGIGPAQALNDSHTQRDTSSLHGSSLAQLTPPLSGSLSLHLLGAIQWIGDSPHSLPPPCKQHTHAHSASNSLTLTLQVVEYHNWVLMTFCSMVESWCKMQKCVWKYATLWISVFGEVTLINYGVLLERDIHITFSLTGMMSLDI